MRYLYKSMPGTTVNGSAVIKGLTNARGLAAGESTADLTHIPVRTRIAVTGTGIPANTFVASIDSDSQVTLTNNATASGTVELAFSLILMHDGSIPLIAVWATAFGGGTVTIQGSPDGGTTWIILTQQIGNTPATFTVNSFSQCWEIAMGYLIRATLTGAVGASNVNVQLGI